MGVLAVVDDGSGHHLVVTDDLTCKVLDAYLTDPLIISSCALDSEASVFFKSETISAVNKTSAYLRPAFMIDESDAFLSGNNPFGGQTMYLFTIDTIDNQGNTSTLTDRTVFPELLTDPSNYTFNSMVSTNIPIFKSNTPESVFVEYSTDSHITEERLNAILKQYTINYDIVEEPAGDDFMITNPWQHGTWTENGVSTSGNLNYRNVMGKIKDGGRVSFYKVPFVFGDADLKYGVHLSAEFVNLQYSVDGINWQDVDEFPFNFFYRVRENELGEFNFGYSLYSNLFPIWENEEDSDAYMRGEKDITEALNWPEISGEYDITNSTGDDSPATVFGQSYMQNFFSQQYILTDSALRDIANGLFDTSQGGIWQDIKQGLDMFGEDPIQAVMGLSFWPVDLTTVFTSISSQNYVYFGGYKFDITNGSCHKILFPNGYKTVANQKIVRSFQNWRDFEPYTKLYIMLPYCGTYQLDLARYYDKTLEVRYYFDTRTNSCIAALISGGHLIDYFNGQVGCTMPITLTSFSDFANAQIQTLLGGGGQATQTFGSAVGTGLNAATVGGAGGLVGGLIGGGVAALPAAGVAAKTVYGLSQNNINDFNKTKGGSSSMINQFLPQKVTLIWELQKDCAPKNYGEIYGYPSMTAGTIGSFSGFLKCQSVKISCPVATESERERLKQMLMSGIYI